MVALRAHHPATMVPIYPASTAGQARYVLGHIAVRFVFVGSQALLAKLAAVRSELTQVLERSDSTASEAKPPKERAEHVQHVIVFDAALAPAAVDAFGAERVHTWDALLALGTAAPGDSYSARVGALGLEDVGLVLYTSDRLWNRSLTVGGQPADLGAITCPVLAVSFEADTIAPAAACDALVDMVAASHKRAVRLPGSHISGTTSSAAAKNLWPLLSGFWGSRD